MALVGIDFPEERSTSIIRVTRIGELGTLAITSSRLVVTANIVPSSPILVTLIMVVLHSSKMSVLTIATWSNTPENGIHQEVKNWKNVKITCQEQTHFL
jgi:cobalamin synthase